MSTDADRRRSERSGQHVSLGRTPDLWGWPRLLNLEQGAAYVGISSWVLRELINDGTVPLVRVPRPQTARERRRGAIGDAVRRLLIDRADLDALVERWKERV